MANYATPAQCRARLDSPNISIQIDQLSHTNNESEQNDFLEQFLEEASGLIDAYIDTKYTTPVTITADNVFLRGLCLDIAVHEIFKRGSGDDIPKKYRDNYEDAIRILEDIAEGLLSVPGVATKIKNTSVDVETDTTVFTEDDLVKYF